MLFRSIIGKLREEKNNIQYRIQYLLVAAVVLFAFIPGKISASSEKANELYNRAQKAYNNDKYLEAIDYLKRAYREKPDVVYKYNQIIALEKLGKQQEALRLLREHEYKLKKDHRIQDIAKLERRLRAGVEATHLESHSRDESRGFSRKTVVWGLIGLSGASFAAAGLLETGLFLPKGFESRQNCMNDPEKNTSVTPS